MANGKLLRQLIRSGADGDLDVFRGIAKQVIAEERQKQHHLLANDLESILYGRSQSSSSPALRNLVAAIPEDREREIAIGEKGLGRLGGHGTGQSNGFCIARPPVNRVGEPATQAETRRSSFLGTSLTERST